MTDILQGHITALFAFDLGYAVRLEELRKLLPTFPVQPLSRKKLTPPYLQYTRPPLRIGLGTSDAFLGRTAQVRLTVFDFGAASLAYTWPIGASGSTGTSGTTGPTPTGGSISLPERLALGEIPALGQSLYMSSIEQDARERVSRLMGTISPAIERPDLSDIVEDFYLFVFEKLNSAINASELLAHHRPTLAQLLRLEVAALSAQQQTEAVSSAISYYDTDLVLIDWNAGVIFDQDYEDTANVLELLNIGLLESRYVDAQLDEHIERYSGIVREKRVSFIPLRSPHRKAIQELAELSTEAALLSERTENALKLVGDLYLARIYAAAAERFHLKEWDHIISNKLAIISRFYDLLNDRAQTAQSQALELVVVLLILVEVVIAIVQWPH